MKTPSALTLSPAATATLLARELGGSTTTWETWLKNQRRADRQSGKARELEPVAGPGRPRYALAALEAFIDAARQSPTPTPADPTAAASRVSEVQAATGGTRYGRPFDAQVIAGFTEDGAGEVREPFVRLIVSNPLTVYRLGLDQAQALAAELNSTVLALARAFGTQAKPAEGEGRPS